MCIKKFFNSISPIVINRRRVVHSWWFFLLLIFSGWGQGMAAEEGNTKLSGSLLIAGNGPERYLLQALAQEFEHCHPGLSVDFFWHPNAKPIRTVQLDEADIGVTGEVVSDLHSTVIARDGIAILTNFSNPIEEITTQQIAEVFSGKIKYWSEIHEEAPQTRIILINRSSNQNIAQGMKKALAIKGRIPHSGKTVGPEQHAINEVAGNLNAVTFVSMTPALRAQSDGIAVNLLFVDRVEPEYQTVLDGRYPLQRPVVLVTKPEPSPLVKAFVKFVFSDPGQRIVKRGTYYPLKKE